MNLPPLRPFAVCDRSSAFTIRRVALRFLQYASHAASPQVRQEVDANLRILLDSTAPIHGGTRNPRKRLRVDGRSVGNGGMRSPVERQEPCCVHPIFDSLDKVFDYLEVRFAMEDGVFGGPGL